MGPQVVRADGFMFSPELPLSIPSDGEEPALDAAACHLGNRAVDEPLLPIEKKLIVWSLSLGIVLLVGLVIVSRMFIHA